MKNENSQKKLKCIFDRYIKFIDDVSICLSVRFLSIRLNTPTREENEMQETIIVMTFYMIKDRICGQTTIKKIQNKAAIGITNILFLDLINSPRQTAPAANDKKSTMS